MMGRTLAIPITKHEEENEEFCPAQYIYSTVLCDRDCQVLPIIDVLGYDGQNSSFSSSPPPPPPPYSDSTPITQKGSHIST